MFLTHMFPWTSPSNDAIIKKQLKLVSTDVGYIAQVLAQVSLGYTSTGDVFLLFISTQDTLLLKV